MPQLEHDLSEPVLDSLMSAELANNLRFGFLIHDVSRLRRVVIDRVLKPLGITRSQWWVLSFLARRDGMTQTALAGDLDRTKVAIGALLDQLEISGFVERRPDLRDRRLRRVFMTLTGKSLLNLVITSLMETEDMIIASVNADALNVAATSLFLIKKRLLSIVEEHEGSSAVDTLS